MEEISRSRGLMGSVRRWLGGRSAAVSQIPAQPAEPAPAAAAIDRRVDVMLAEWRDVRASLRHADGTRLAQLALFIAGSAAIAGGYLAVAAAPDPRLDLARWALPALGLLVSLVFLALELGSIAYQRALARRGRQIETATQILLPGTGRVRPLALLCDLHIGEGEWARAAVWVAGALYGLALLAWIAALLATALGSR